MLKLVVSLHRFFQFYLIYNRDYEGTPPPPTLEYAIETILGHVKTALTSIEAEEAQDLVASSTKDDAPLAAPEPTDSHLH